MKLMILPLFLLSSLSFADDLEQRSISLNQRCQGKEKINLGVYKLNKSCQAKLDQKEIKSLQGICRGLMKYRNAGKYNVEYKISFSTDPSNPSLNYHAVTKDSLWDIKKNNQPEIDFYQPTWSYSTQQKILIVNKKTDLTVQNGADTLVHVKTPEVDLLVTQNTMFMQHIDKEQASIKIKHGNYTYELENAVCDLML
jgi:hypothetical protein